MPRAYIGLGSNMGNPVLNLETALKRIDGIEGIRITATSSVYETEPVGYEEQAWFHNCVAEIDTLFSPEELLCKLQEIENELGRVRLIRWGPRTIDLDILLYDRAVINTERLIIPHPRMAERAFVMVPLAEIAPDAEFPDGRTAAQVTELINDNKKFTCIHRKL
ncbi:2-amino-4-hydroxy-6-hydroxymethyldihydropteridine diphosphokinase [Phosphitispora fastidiosa]|uniref:2-amino-4-hydroxy-6- hydroxymethyldihydropteridine diphosphokinase n=1 Tax=Phosphitispora fastidiosa TaxID=2837202 RepID=UPI001E5CFE34|nr:2-amino-4-hydroxy-6-hydroxymethyldihydropteridine diphosphokinase [Phosphitispora fastidiosa]MBU7007824.1 2-amino-4-hydroxy-6-hydroxymethyldihydropteridine diphosphokinase [Phosphitispora fastidiosa]